MIEDEYSNIYAVPKPIKLSSEAKKLQRMEKRLEKAKQAASKAKEPKLSLLKKKVQREVNAYVRLRDTNDPCISCQKFVMMANVDAGHYISQGSSGALRYNLDNIHKQCVACNRYNHGALVDYGIHLREKIVEERVKWLEDHRKDNKKWTREELEAIRADIKQKTAELITNPLAFESFAQEEA
jgi:hypothetical protein